MKFALNYSHAAARLIERGAIDVDLLKCPDWPDLLPEALKLRPCYVHFAFRVGRRRMAQVDWAQIDKMREATRTPFVNAHLGPCIRDFPGMALETRDPADRARVIEAMERDIGELTSRYGVDRVLLENVMWDPVDPWLIPQPATEPATIRQLVMGTGCGFVLDLAHAQIAARHLGMDVMDYLAQLPTARLRELHVTGLKLDDMGLWGDHHPMTDADWPLFEYAMGQIRRGDWPAPWVVSFEYGGLGPAYANRTDERVIAGQVPRFLEAVRE